MNSIHFSNHCVSKYVIFNASMQLKNYEDVTNENEQQQKKKRKKSIEL